MKVEFKASFLKDIGKIRTKNTLKRVKAIIEYIESTDDLRSISELKKLKGGGGNYYRIRVEDYRIGLSITKSKCIFVRCLDRKEIYRYFP